MTTNTNAAQVANNLIAVAEDQAFEAWYKQDCLVGGVNARIAARAAWNARAALTTAAAPAAVAGPSQETCQTCQGNGEVVTDWERYKHPLPGDVGDEAVAECQDCDGQGTVDAAPTTQAEPQREVFDEEGFRAWVIRNLPDNTIIGNGEWWANHIAAWVQRFMPAAPHPAPVAQGDARAGKFMTVVYRDISPGEEARALCEHPKASAMSWSHALNERDAARAAVQASRAAHPAAPVAQGDAPTDSGPISRQWLTVVYRGVEAGDEVQQICTHPKVSAMSWSHALHDRDVARRAQATLPAVVEPPHQPKRTVTYVCPVCAASLERQE